MENDFTHEEAQLKGEAAKWRAKFEAAARDAVGAAVVEGGADVSGWAVEVVRKGNADGDTPGDQLRCYFTPPACQGLSDAVCQFRRLKGLQEPEGAAIPAAARPFAASPAATRPFAATPAPAATTNLEEDFPEIQMEEADELPPPVTSYSLGIAAGGGPPGETDACQQPEGHLVCPLSVLFSNGISDLSNLGLPRRIRTGAAAAPPPPPAVTSDAAVAATVEGAAGAQAAPEQQ